MSATLPEHGRLESWYICDRAHGYHGEPNCQSIAGPPIDEAVGRLMAEKMTPAAVELALEIRREIEVRHEEADQLRCRAIERAQIDADLAQRRFMLVDPTNRLVADTLEANLEREAPQRSPKLAEDQETRTKEQDQFILDEAVRERLIAMTVDFSQLSADPDTPDHELKRLLGHIIEDVTLVKMPAEGTTRFHVRFKGGKIQTLTTMSPKSSAQQVKTPSGIVELVDKLLDRTASLRRSPNSSTSKDIAREDQRGAAATMPASQPCWSPISSIGTACARAMTDYEIAGC